VSVLEAFEARFGTQILEGYGLSETSPTITANQTRHGTRPGTVGHPVWGVEVEIADPTTEDEIVLLGVGERGEVVARGHAVFEGYLDDPEATERAVVDGWFRTGDIGEVDENGFVRITDRKKDVFKTSGGKYVSPALIEARFKSVCPVAGQFVVVGNERNYPAALVTLDPPAIEVWAQENGLGDKEYADIVATQEVHDLVARYVEEVNEGLNRWERVKRFAILDHDLTVDTGDLTPSLKLRRRKVLEKYADVVDGLYAAEH